jgi:hypothetical protein
MLLIVRCLVCCVGRFAHIHHEMMTCSFMFARALEELPEQSELQSDTRPSLLVAGSEDTSSGREAWLADMIEIGKKEEKDLEQKCVHVRYHLHHLVLCSRFARPFPLVLGPTLSLGRLFSCIAANLNGQPRENGSNSSFGNFNLIQSCVGDFLFSEKGGHFTMVGSGATRLCWEGLLCRMPLVHLHRVPRRP